MNISLASIIVLIIAISSCAYVGHENKTAMETCMQTKSHDTCFRLVYGRG